MNKYGIEVKAERDIIPVRGNAMASGDAKLDKREEDRILRQLRDGNVWAWAAVTVRAIDADGNIGEDHLGCCSYNSEADFRESDYFADMKAEAIRDLEERKAHK